MTTGNGILRWRVGFWRGREWKPLGVVQNLCFLWRVWVTQVSDSGQDTLNCIGLLSSGIVQLYYITSSTINATLSDTSGVVWTSEDSPQRVSLHRFQRHVLGGLKWSAALRRIYTSNKCEIYWLQKDPCRLVVAHNDFSHNAYHCKCCQSKHSIQNDHCSSL